jgi:stage III sporulation protein AH
MLLKKQTVWLLTMLSLVVVLSVYYLTSPESTQNNLATTEQQKNNDSNENTAVTEEQSESEPTSESTEKPDSRAEDNGESATETKTKSDEASVKITSGDEEFEALRMQIDDERAKLNEELMNKVGNTELSAEEINKAYEAVEQLSETKVKENILEGMIVSMDYDAALVRVDGNDVKVTVRADQHSPTDANKIIRLVRGEIEGANDIVVDFQVKK